MNKRLLVLQQKACIRLSYYAASWRIHGDSAICQITLVLVGVVSVHILVGPWGRREERARAGHGDQWQSVPVPTKPVCTSLRRGGSAGPRLLLYRALPFQPVARLDGSAAWRRDLFCVWRAVQTSRQLHGQRPRTQSPDDYLLDELRQDRVSCRLSTL